MTEEKAVVNLLREKESYKEEAGYLRKALEEIQSGLYCIGGPLNDNSLQFNKKQQEYLIRNIAKVIEHVI